MTEDKQVQDENRPRVMNVTVTPDETGMRVDRFLEARFPGLSFSHIQRVVRKGELRVDGKRVETKDRLEAGQVVRIPPLRVLGVLSAESAKFDLGAEVEHVFAQNRVAAFETTTPAYTMVNLSATWRPMGEDGPLSLVLSGTTCSM